MDPVTVSIVVSAPREQVFDYLQDIANHPEFTDHYLVDWHLTRIDSVGRGAGARFRVKDNRIRTLGVYDLAPVAAGATRVRFTLQTIPAKLSDRLMEGLGARSWTRRKNGRALRRLRGIFEQGEGGPGAAAGRARRVTVAGG
jgi:hypothetical protein